MKKNQSPTLSTTTTKNIYLWKMEIIYSPLTSTDTSRITAPITITYSSTTPQNQNRKTGPTSYRSNITIMKIFSPRKISTNSQNDDHGIMPSTSPQVLNQLIARPIICRHKSRKSSRSSLTKIFAQVEYALHHPLWLHHFSLSRRKTDRYAQLKITES